MLMKRIIALLAALLVLACAVVMSGCEPMVDEYQSDTFELGESSRY